jgi:hypothetical protein
VNAGPEVDVVIPVHDASRPIGRAVASVLDRTSAHARVTVVCHDIAVERIAEALGPRSPSDRLRLLGHEDGIRSPAGPLNAGLAAVEAPFFSVMGSDDELAPGALDAWLDVQTRTDADVVIPTMSVVEGSPVATPPTRVGRRARLDGVRDRLAYRSAPLGLIRTSRFGGLRFTEGLATGEDIAYSTRLWFTDAALALARREPGYLVHADAGERVTTTRRPVHEELAAVADLIRDVEVGALDPTVRQAIAVKLVRVNVFGAVTNRSDPSGWTMEDRASLRRIADALIAWSPLVVEVLSRADSALLDAIRAEDEPSRLIALAAARRRFGTPATIIPRRLRRLFAPQAPLALMAGSWWIRAAARRAARDAARA